MFFILAKSTPLGGLRPPIHPAKIALLRFLRCLRARTRPWDVVPHPTTFEKVDETFTVVRLARQTT